MLAIKIKKRFAGSTGSKQQATTDEFTLDVEFEAPPGVTILFGASGSGKSTTLRSVAGIIRPDAGHISIAGQTFFDSEHGVDLEIRKRRVGFVFQNLAL